MDVVSDAIAAVRTGRPSSNRLRVGGRWAARLPRFAGAGFHVVLAGGCWLLPEGGEPVRLERGDVVLLPHGGGHALSDRELTHGQALRLPELDVPLAAGLALAEPGDGGKVVELLCGKYRLDHGLTHPLMRELPEVVRLSTLSGEHPELRAAVELLGAEVASVRPGGELAVPALVDLLLVYLVRAWTTRRGAVGWGAALADPVVAAVLAAVHEDPAHPWTVGSLAERAGVSRATLVRRFTARTGRPPMAYLTWWRMTRAATLLRRGADPLETVAREVGYGSPYALSHAFARQFGTTPGRYRAAATA
ncbi:AraC family transcriptional regulator [Streptomyces rubellomurinus]|uniref:AraC family transcriptional regulator n=1 Tax=Streptomyces rubellomurinus (strain ATCC 31215) TaxID=359131 RepID=A0A0F2T8X5_STRR3|nr:AraC family transcriptional regulator [Streptomyces rubellomurinus]KJS59648.1 AraC family transcriptional regulator [Streptomyces rubellomurinus]